MRKLLVIFITVLLYFACVPGVFAVTVSHLNQITVPVSSRSEDQLSQAFREAFMQVLVKMSGNPYVMTLPTIQNAMSGVPRWVQSYNYVSPESAGNQSTLGLQVTFDQSGVKQLLKEAGQSLWQGDRPLTLLFVNTSSDQSQDEKQLQVLLSQQASTLGLPVIFPVMDLTDRELIGDDEHHTLLQLSQMLALAKRYGVISMLVGQLKQLPDQTWQSDWRYVFNGQDFRWQLNGATEQSVITPAYSKMMIEMVNQLAATEGQGAQSKLTLEIVGVNDIADYAKVMRSLKQREDVRKIAVQSVNDAGVLFSLEINGDLATFQAALAKSNEFKPVSDTLKQGALPADLYFYWAPQTVAAVKALGDQHDTV